METHPDIVSPVGYVPAGGLSVASRPASAVPERARRAGAYVPEIDAVRGLAMSAVIAFHCKLLPFGWMGVWLFYVVSGFAVTTSLLTGPPRQASVAAAIRRFYVRRALRIWPLYFAFLGLNVVVLLALGKTGPLGDLPWLLTFTHNLRMMFTVYTPETDWSAFGHLWTLAVEQQFYFVFPLLLLVSGRRSRGLVLLCVIAAAPLIRALTAQYAVARGWDPGRVSFAVYVFAPAHFDAFAAGALIALFRDEIARERRLAHAAFAVAALVGVLHVGVYATLGLERVGHVSPEAMRNIVSGIVYGQGREVSVYLIPTAVAVAVLMGLLSREPRCLALCRLPGLQAIGRVSYGGYLLHVPVLMVLGTLIPAFGAPMTSPLAVAGHLGLFISAYPLTVGLAWLSFTFFEQRFSPARPTSERFRSRSRRTQPAD